VGNLGVPELLIIAGVIILLFGARKLPEMARSLGKSAKAFKEETKGMRGKDGDDTDAADTASTPAQPVQQQQLPQAQPPASNGVVQPTEQPVEQSQQNKNAS
jgi:sec-independent protein translocase protein TatA